VTGPRRVAPDLTGRAASGHVRTAAGLALRAAPASLIGLIVLTLIEGTVPIAAAWLTGRILDALISGLAPWSLVWLAVALAGTGIAAAVLPRLTGYAAAELDRQVRLTAADQLYTTLTGRLQGLATLENPQFHDSLRLAQEAGGTAPGDLVRHGMGMVRNVVTLAGFLGTLVLVNPWLVLAVAVATVPTTRAEILLSRLRAAAMWRIGYAGRRQFFYAHLLTAPREAKEVRLFGLGAFFRGRMLAELRSANADSRLLDRRELRIQTVLGVLGAVVAGAGLVWAVLSTRSGRLTEGELMVFVAALAGVQGSLLGLVGQFGAVHNAVLLLDHYHVAMTLPPDLPLRAAPAPVPPLTDAIEFDDVWFRYGPDHPWVLRGVSLVIPAGSATALVGLNGAGKSTVVKLLCRLYDPTRGQIRWNGVDLRDTGPAELRNRIGAVFQDFIEYELSGAENIGLGDVARLDDRDRIEAAGRRAGVHDALARLPKGYDTMLTRMFIEGIDTEDPDTGMLLSGGQGQRLALARALMRDDRDLLILDEPSSGLDAEAEAEVHAELRRHRAGRTSLLISHRLNTVRDADQIAVLADGEIVERGTHDTLTVRDGIYARLFALQARGYAESRAE
jgi:ATP-binding cassette, subfamily B, bacterial